MGLHPRQEFLFMKNINGSLIRRTYNVNVDKNIYNNVYDDNVSSKIRDAIDKPKAIGEILAEELNAPQNLKFYIKLAYLYPQETLFECLALTNEAAKENRITTDRPRYFYGIVRRKKRNE